MLRSVRYLALAFLTAWVVWNLFTRERRRRIDAGFQRAATVISLGFVAIGVVLLIQATLGAGGEAGQAVLIIAVGLGLMAYQRWGQ